MLTLQELLNGVKCLDENTLAELSDKLWELGTLDDIKEKVTPELFTLHICMNMVGNWQCDGWWYIICEQVKLVPFIPEALNALGLFTLKTAFEKVISCFPQDTIFTDDNNYIDTVNFLQNNRFKVSTINEQISNFAQTYPTNLKASSNEALLFMRRYRFANCSCFSCCFKDAYPSSNVQ